MAIVVNNIRRPISTNRGRRLEAELVARYQSYDSDLQYLPKAIEDFKSEIIDHTIYLKDVWGVNWRKFWVGALGVASVAGEVILLEGANHSPELFGVSAEEATGINRNCAEMGVFWWAYQIALQRRLDPSDVAIQHLFIAGPSDPIVNKTCTGRAESPLAFCYDCGPMLMDNPHASPELPVTMIDPGWKIATVDSTVQDVVDSYVAVTPPLSSNAAAVAANAGGFACRLTPAYCRI